MDYLIEHALSLHRGEISKRVITIENNSFSDLYGYLMEDDSVLSTYKGYSFYMYPIGDIIYIVILDGDECGKCLLAKKRFPLLVTNF